MDNKPIVTPGGYEFLYQLIRQWSISYVPHLDGESEVQHIFTEHAVEDIKKQLGDSNE